MPHTRSVKFKLICSIVASFVLQCEPFHVLRQFFKNSEILHNFPKCNTELFVNGEFSKILLFKTFLLYSIIQQNITVNFLSVFAFKSTNASICTCLHLNIAKLAMARADYYIISQLLFLIVSIK